MRPTTYRIRRGLDDLLLAMYRERAPLRDLRLLPLGVGIAPGETPIPTSDAPGWRPISPGDHWGGQDQYAWFHGEATVPDAWRSALSPHASITLRLLLGVSTEFGWPEGLLYVNGRLLQGINQHHPDVLLPGRVVADSGRLTFDIRAWSGMLPQDHRLEYAEVALLDRDAEALYHLLAAGCDLVDALNENDPLLAPLAAALDHAYDRLDLRTPAGVASSASEALGGLRAALTELRECGPQSRPVVTAIGHGHLDIAWLWQTRHTREKTARTFGVATALMDLYPEYHFLHTSPQAFAWLERDYPELFARVRERVAEGRFEAAGAMWLESDTNLVTGESLVRQLLYGQRYLRETFGREYDTLWLPDTFGYSAALPQILVRAGIRAFMTTKMSWSDTNRIPYDTFRWRGLDGSETLAHFVTTPWLPFNPAMDTDTYNGRLDTPAVRQLWERYRGKAQNQDLLLIFGHGDGGAGPTRQHLESARALRELPGMPDVRLGRADEYFRALRERVWTRTDLPTWDGELYLEYHRGVYTTQAWLKRLHRRLEERLLYAETLYAWRWSLAWVAGASLPDQRPALDDAWRTLLLHQFHDILPGSSIGPVYADARRDLSALATRLDSFIVEAEAAVAASALSRQADAALLINPAPCFTPDSAGLLSLALEGDAAPATLVTAEGHPLPSQVARTPDGARVALYQTPAVSGRGLLPLTIIPADHATQAGSGPTAGEGAPAVNWTTDGGVTLENRYYRLTLDANGEIVSLRDKRAPGERELIAAGAVGNHFKAFDDRPRRFDAWDIDAGYERKPYPMDHATLADIEVGPVRASVHVTRRYQGSVIEQDISLYRDTPRIDFATRVDWRERHTLLKVAFPLDLRVTHARSEIQYGSIGRPTHTNTSWDQARFETVAHRWVDLSETGYGVALLNDGRYGHDIHGSTVRLTILRSPTLPDPEADQGVHEVTYSLLPHLGAWPSGSVIAHGYALNRPLRLIAPTASGATPGATDGATGASRPLFTSRDPSIVIEAVKRAAEGDDLIIRLYEATGGRTQAHIACALPFDSVVETDLLERPLREGDSPAFALWRASSVASHDEPQPEADGWTCAMRPFEVRTFRVRLARATP